MSSLYIAEKPSFAKEIVNGLMSINNCKPEKSNGFVVVGDDCVTWCFGHMYQMAPPKAYGFTQWKMDQLPMLINDWILEIDPEKKDQVNIIKSLIKKYKIIVNCGDAGREGQLLVDEILEDNKINPFSKNIKRLWVQSMSQSDIIKAIKNQFDNEEKKGLYYAALARQRADWEHGMNMTQLITLLSKPYGNRMVLPIGRVKTPTLNLVVERDILRENFIPKTYFKLYVFFKNSNGSFKTSYINDDNIKVDEENRILDESILKKIVSDISSKKGIVTKIESNAKSVKPPLLYSLSELQKAGDKKYSMQAKEILDIAQSLYEKHKIISYPRSDSQYLPLSLREDANSILMNLKSMNSFNIKDSMIDVNRKSDAWNDSKVSDHHGLIPTKSVTKEALRALSDGEEKIFDLIAKSFIAQYCDTYQYDQQIVEVTVENHLFRGYGKKIKNLGWREVFDNSDDNKKDDDEEEDILPDIKKQESVSIQNHDIQKKQTTPPPMFTDGTLVNAMSNIHKYVESTEHKKLLKDNEGIGTEATRANIIEELIRQKLFIRKGKNNLISSSLGRLLIQYIPDDLKSPILTAKWESQLEKIAKNEIEYSTFFNELNKFISEIINKYRNYDVKINSEVDLNKYPQIKKQCPKCHKGLLFLKATKENKFFIACSDYPSCNYSEPSNENRVKIEGDGKPCSLCGKPMVTKSYKKDDKINHFLGCTGYPECKNTEWPKVKSQGKPVKKCPTCKTGNLFRKKITSKKDGKIYEILSCDNYPDCKHSEFENKK